MPTGNYIFNPQNPQALQESDLDDFVFTLLNDICSESSNLNLKDKSKIQFYIKENVTEIKDGTDFLISFDVAKDDPRNLNLRRELKSNGNYLEVVYRIGVIAKIYNGDGNENDLSEVKRILEEIVDGITDNWNGKLVASNTIEGQGHPTPYEVVLNNGKKLRSSLTSNKADNYFDVSVDQPENPNYIAIDQKILFKITRS
jgi:hypothetical protein